MKNIGQQNQESFGFDVCDMACETCSRMICTGAAALDLKASNTDMNAKVKTRKPHKYKGIMRHAAELGVSRGHLWMVLTGQRHSSSLLQRYHKLVNAGRRSAS